MLRHNVCVRHFSWCCRNSFHCVRLARCKLVAEITCVTFEIHVRRCGYLLVNFHSTRCTCKYELFFYSGHSKPHCIHPTLKDFFSLDEIRRKGYCCTWFFVSILCIDSNALHNYFMVIRSYYITIFHLPFSITSDGLGILLRMNRVFMNLWLVICDLWLEMFGRYLLQKVYFNFLTNCTRTTTF